MPVLPRGPALRQHVPVWAESHPIREGCRSVAAYLNKTDVGNFHDGDIAFLVETRYGKSREPQNLLHLGQAFGNLDVRIWWCVGKIVVLQRKQFPVACGLVGKVHAQLVDAALGSNQPVPVPERWRKG